MEPVGQVQRVCDHLAQIIRLQNEVTDLKSQQLLPPQYDQTEIEEHIRTLREE